jgi:translation elongation factor EF-Ts
MQLSIIIAQTLEELKATPYENLTITDKIMETVAKIGEKIDITSFERLNQKA